MYLYRSVVVFPLFRLDAEEIEKISLCWLGLEFHIKNKLYDKKKILFFLMGLLLVGTITVVAAEVMIRFVSPQRSMYPRWEFSSRYGFEPFESTEMVHTLPGQWRYIYSINEYRYRGEAVPISDRYRETNVVVLGDSYTFGQGVQDNEVYTAVMQRILNPDFSVINLGVGGWGLTQQIRRYYEFGRLYEPRFVILQFSSNDPSDNVRDRVTIVEDGRFRFQEAGGSTNHLRKYLSRSIIFQKSQLYNLFRDAGYAFVNRSVMEDAQQELALDHDRGVPDEEQLYNELLEVFAKSLHERGVDLIVMAVEEQLSSFPHIRDKILDLESEGHLLYVDTAEWFDWSPGLPGHYEEAMSPEGHWGEEAHRLIGTKLSEIVLGL